MSSGHKGDMMSWSISAQAWLYNDEVVAGLWMNCRPATTNPLPRAAKETMLRQTSKQPAFVHR